MLFWKCQFRLHACDVPDFETRISRHPLDRSKPDHDYLRELAAQIQRLYGSVRVKKKRVLNAGCRSLRCLVSAGPTPRIGQTTANGLGRWSRRGQETAGRANFGIACIIGSHTTSSSLHVNEDHVRAGSSGRVGLETGQGASSRRPRPTCPGNIHPADPVESIIIMSVRLSCCMCTEEMELTLTGLCVCVCVGQEHEAFVQGGQEGQEDQASSRPRRRRHRRRTILLIQTQVKEERRNRRPRRYARSTHSRIRASGPCLAVGWADDELRRSTDGCLLLSLPCPVRRDAIVQHGCFPRIQQRSQGPPSSGRPRIRRRASR